MVRTNLTGPFRLIRASMPHLLRSRGAIVEVSSAASLRATPDIAGYNVTRAGLNMLMQSVAVDYGPESVRANAVCPCWPRTEMADMEMGEDGEALGLDAEGAYARATSLVNAAVMPVDGGMIATDPGALAMDPRVTA